MRGPSNAASPTSSLQTSCVARSGPKRRPQDLHAEGPIRWSPRTRPRSSSQETRRTAGSPGRRPLPSRSTSTGWPRPSRARRGGARGRRDRDPWTSIPVAALDLVTAPGDRSRAHPKTPTPGPEPLHAGGSGPTFSHLDGSLRLHWPAGQASWCAWNKPRGTTWIPPRWGGQRPLALRRRDDPRKPPRGCWQPPATARRP